VNAVILNGMEPGDSSVASIQDMLVNTLEERTWSVKPFILHEIDVKPCGGCFGCWIQTPGRCVRHDTDAVAASVTQSDLTIYLTPVTFGGYSSQLKKVLDHLIFLILPFFKTVDGETHHVPRYRKRANLLVIGTMDRADRESEAIFTTLAERNAINMSAPRWATGVVVEEEGSDAARQVVEDLLKDVEVVG
jgi:multimeric flavodoxin WrbA